MTVAIWFTVDRLENLIITDKKNVYSA